MDPSEPQAIVCSGVRFTRERIEAVRGDRAVKGAARGDLRRIALRHGFLSEHPLLQALLGAGLACGGWPALAAAGDWLHRGGTLLDLFALMALLVPLGGWATYDALRRGYYLEVTEKARRRKFGFAGAPEVAAIRSALDEARARLGYEVEVAD